MHDPRDGNVQLEMQSLLEMTIHSCRDDRQLHRDRPVDGSDGEQEHVDGDVDGDDK